MTEAATRKSRLRQSARAVAVRPTPSRSAEAALRVLALPELAGARTVSLYAALADEIQCEGIAAALAGRGVRVLLPRVAGADLELREREPAVTQAIRASEVDVFVVPGLLFDRCGRRLGRGGGHFDRLLARARPDALRVGVCLAERLVAELPEESWDVRMHRVVTELETLRASEPARATDGAT